MFRRSAAYYDLIYRELKDYAEEALRLHYLLGKLDPAPKRLLDVGCGTGEHARLLHDHFGYQVDGIDIEPELIALASKKHPAGEFSVGDMRRFALPRPYDAVLCLFSSIGYVETKDGLEQALACMRQHLQPGGWLICEPWTTPDQWKPGQIDAVEAIDPASGVSVTRTREGSTEGQVSILSIEYDISGPAGRSHFEEVHRLGLFSRDEMEAALTAAGFAFSWSPDGLHKGALILARRLD